MTPAAPLERRAGSIPLPLHVRLVSWDDEPPVGGQGVYVRDLRRALQDRGLKVSTIAGRGQFSMPFRRYTNRPHFDMSLALNRSTSPLVSGMPDVVHISGGPGGVQVLRRLEVPVVYTAHHTFRLAHRPWSPLRAYGFFEGLSYRRAVVVAAVSPSTAESLFEMGLSSSKIVVIPPGIKVDELGISNAEREPGRVLFVGRLEPEKGALDAVRVMTELGRRLGTRSYVVGDGSLRQEVLEAASRSQGSVTFLGRISDEEVLQQYRRAQLVIMPSTFEGLGLVALEAMATGSAVAGYDVVGLHDTIASKGCLVAHGDVRALVQTSTKLLQDASYRDEVVGRALERIRKVYSWTRCASDFEELYREIVGSHVEEHIG